MNDNLVPLGIVFDLPICLHIPDQDYLVFNSSLKKGYFQLAFKKVNQNSFFDRLGSITHQFRYSKVMVGFPGSMIIPMGPDIDPITGEKKWRKIINPGSESDLLQFNEKCIQPMLGKYRLEEAICIAGIKPVNRFLSLYRQRTENFFAHTISEVESFLDLDQVAIYYLVPSQKESKHQKIKIRTIYSPYIGSRIPDIHKDWNDWIYGKLQTEDEVSPEEEILSVANYCFVKGLYRCAVVELESVFELLIKRELVRAFNMRKDEKEIDKKLKKTRRIRNLLSLYDGEFENKGFHEGGHVTYKLWDDAYSVYRNTVSHEGHLISAEDTERFFKDYNEVFLHLFERSVFLNPLKHTIPPSEETIRIT